MNLKLEYKRKREEIEISNSPEKIIRCDIKMFRKFNNTIVGMFHISVDFLPKYSLPHRKQ